MKGRVAALAIAVLCGLLVATLCLIEPFWVAVLVGAGVVSVAWAVPAVLNKSTGSRR